MGRGSGPGSPRKVSTKARLREARPALRGSGTSVGSHETGAATSLASAARFSHALAPSPSASDATVRKDAWFGSGLGVG